MKKTIAGILLLCVCILFLGPAHAQEHAAFSIVRQHLLEHVADASALSRAEIGGIIGDLARSGYAVPEDACGEKANAYDVAMDILQAVLGSYYDWTIEERHGFDRMMVDCGELDRCYNLLPGDGEIAKEDAQRIALGEIAAGTRWIHRSLIGFPACPFRMFGRRAPQAGESGALALR